MTEALQSHIIQRLGHAPQHLDVVLAKFKSVTLKRNEHLLNQGEVCKHVYFVVKGCLQVYVLDKDLNENTRDLVLEDSWCSDLMSFGQQQPSAENIKAVEPTSVLAIHRDGFFELMASVPPFEAVYKQILEASYANAVYRINSFVSMTALDRLKWLMEHRPYLMTRVSGRLIASYLGIHKDVFSRLRSKM